MGCFEEVEKKCSELAGMQATETQKIGAKLLEISETYYKDVRLQADRSFKAALWGACIGMGIFVVAVSLGMTNWSDKKTITMIIGAIPEIISGVVFYLYFKTMRQFGHFHVCLERMNRYLIANGILANIPPGVKQDETRAELVQTMAHAPMLRIEGINEDSREPLAKREAKNGKTNLG